MIKHMMVYVIRYDDTQCYNIWWWKIVIRYDDGKFYTDMMISDNVKKFIMIKCYKILLR
jgi:hypothetical protein